MISTYKIPLGWKMETIGNCCVDAFTGKSPKYSKTKTEYKIIGQQSNQRYGLDFRYIKYGTTEFGLTQEKRFFLKYNDVLLNTLGTGSIGRSGIYKLNEPILTDGHLFVFRTSKNCLPNYLFYYLRFNEKEIIDSASGSTNQKFLKLKSFLDFVIPVPPLSEQERIVARIEELFSQLDAGVETLKKIKAQLAIYRQAVLKEAFDSVSGNQSVLSNFIVEKPRNGYSPKPVNYETRFRNLTLSATTSGIFKPEYYKFIDIEISSDSYLWVKHNDILIQRANTIDYVGTAVLYSGEDDLFVYPDLMMKCHPIESVIPQYLLYQLTYQRLRGYYRKNATGTAGSMPKINQATVCNTPIVMTSINEQIRIVSKIESSLSVCDNIEQTVDASLQQADALRQSILKDAFEGRL